MILLFPRVNAQSRIQCHQINVPYLHSSSTLLFPSPMERQHVCLIARINFKALLGLALSLLSLRCKMECAEAPGGRFPPLQMHLLSLAYTTDVVVSLHGCSRGIILRVPRMRADAPYLGAK